MTVLKVVNLSLTSQMIYEEENDPILPTPELVPIPVFLNKKRSNL